MSDVASSSWVEHRAVFQGRVSGFERRVRMGPKVPDPGIDLTRKSQGITGWQAQIERQRRRRERFMQEMINSFGASPLTLVEVSTPIDGLKLRDIQEAVSAYSGVRMDEIISPRRQSEIVKSRQIAMLLCKTLTKRSYPEIGRNFGGRDHTTVLHAVRKQTAVEKKLWECLTKQDPLEAWVKTAFSAWDEIGL